MKKTRASVTGEPLTPLEDAPKCDLALHNFLRDFNKDAPLGDDPLDRALLCLIGAEWANRADKEIARRAGKIPWMDKELVKENEICDLKLRAMGYSPVAIEEMRACIHVWPDEVMADKQMANTPDGTSTVELLKRLMNWPKSGRVSLEQLQDNPTRLLAETVQGATIPGRKDKTPAGSRESIIRPMLEKLGWSDETFAKYAEVNYKTVRAYRQGKRNPNASTRQAMAKALKIEVEELPK